MMKLEMLVVTFFHLTCSAPHRSSETNEKSRYVRVVLNDLTFWIFGPGIWVILTLLDPLLRDDELRMRHTGRADLKAPTLKLVLGIDFAKVLPSGCFAIARRRRLHDDVSADGFEATRLTHRMM